MGHKSSSSRYLKELGKNLIESTNATETGIAALLQAESDKIQELIKRNVSTEILLNSGKIFSDMMFNIALAQMIPILKTNNKEQLNLSIPDEINQSNKNTNLYEGGDKLAEMQNDDVAVSGNQDIRLDAEDL